MSYILDALKKSEQQQGHGTIPSVQTVHTSSLNYRDEKKTYWPYILITAVILNLTAVVYFIIDKDNVSENNLLSVQDTTVDNIAATHIAATNTETVAPAATPVKQIRNTIIEPEKTLVQATAKPIKKKTIPGKYNESTTPRSNTNTTVYKQPVQVQKNIIDYYDLPDSIQQQLPTITVSAHVYSSNPLQRSIVINNNFMEEGEYVIDDLILHEITADGAIFDYGETRFHYSVVSGWQ